MRPVLVSFAIGVVFALGLGLSGMTHPAKVVGFLDVAGAWDPALALVMGGALTVHALLRRFILRAPRPVGGGRFVLSTAKEIDGRLLGGSVLFGVGWGLSGYCPGPAFVAVASGFGPVVLFVGAMLAGMALHRLVSRRMPALAVDDGCSPVLPDASAR